jgi:hypothetical protein
MPVSSAHWFHPNIMSHVTHTMQIQLTRAGNATGLIAVSFLLSRLYCDDRLLDSMHPIIVSRTITSNQSIDHRSVALANRINGRLVNAHQPDT